MSPFPSSLIVTLAESKNVPLLATEYTVSVLYFTFFSHNIDCSLTEVYTLCDGTAANAVVANTFTVAKKHNIKRDIFFIFPPILKMNSFYHLFEIFL